MGHLSGETMYSGSNKPVTDNKMQRNRSPFKKLINDPVELPYTVDGASSEDAECPAQGLQGGSSPWQSCKYPNFPQDLILKTRDTCCVSEIRLLLHQTNIPTRIDFFIGSDNGRNNGHSGNCKYVRLGYCSLHNNSHTNYQAIELKSVYFDNMLQCDYLKLRLYRNHRNEQNTYQQVGLLGVLLLGSRGGNPLQALPHVDDNETAAAIAASHPEMTRANQTSYHRLEEHLLEIRMKKESAKNDLNLLSKMHEIEKALMHCKIELVELEQQKQFYVDGEQYDQAAAAKQSIDRLLATVVAPKMSAFNELFPEENLQVDQRYATKAAQAVINNQGQFSDRSDRSFYLNLRGADGGAEGLASLTYTLETGRSAFDGAESVASLQKVMNAVPIPKVPAVASIDLSGTDAPLADDDVFSVVTEPTARSNYAEVGLDERPLPTLNSGRKSPFSARSDKLAAVDEVLPVASPAGADATAEQEQLPEPEPLTPEALVLGALDLIPFFGETTVKSAFSHSKKHSWVLRQRAYQQLLHRLQDGDFVLAKTAKTAKKAKKQAEEEQEEEQVESVLDALLRVANVGVGDKVVNVSVAAARLFVATVTHFRASLSVREADLLSHFVSHLVERLNDSNARARDSSSVSLQALADLDLSSSGVGTAFLVNRTLHVTGSEMIEVKAKHLSWRALAMRMALLDKLVSRASVSTGKHHSLTIQWLHRILQFVRDAEAPAHANRAVREAALGLTVTIGVLLKESSASYETTVDDVLVPYLDDLRPRQREDYLVALAKKHVLVNFVEPPKATKAATDSNNVPQRKRTKPSKEEQGEPQPQPQPQPQSQKKGFLSKLGFGKRSKNKVMAEPEAAEKAATPRNKESSPRVDVAATAATSPRAKKAATPRSKESSPRVDVAATAATSPRAKKAATPRSKKSSPRVDVAATAATSPRTKKAATPRSKESSPQVDVAATSPRAKKAATPRSKESSPQVGVAATSPRAKKTATPRSKESSPQVDVAATADEASK